MKRLFHLLLAIAATVEWLFTPEPDHDLRALP